LCIDQVNRRSGKTERVAGGTGFFVEIEDELDADTTWRYVVTARHCIEDAPASTIYVRANTLVSAPRLPEYIDIPTEKKDWDVHPTADVAAILLPIQSDLALRPIQLKWFADSDYKVRPKGAEYPSDLLKTSKRLGGFDIQAGDDVFFTGLFVESAGKHRNLPIARFGNISRMPELITLKSKTRGEIQVIAYLVEGHSRGGHSGSPVFWHWRAMTGTIVETANKNVRPVVASIEYIRAFIGLVSAHFDTDLEFADSKKGILDAQINSGIVVVTPAENVKELLMDNPKVVGDRRRRAAEVDVWHGATPDFLATEEPQQRTLAPKPEDRVKIPIPTRKQFFKDLAKATQRKKRSKKAARKRKLQ